MSSTVPVQIIVRNVFFILKSSINKLKQLSNLKIIDCSSFYIILIRKIILSSNQQFSAGRSKLLIKKTFIFKNDFKVAVKL